ncbi:MAG TPA: non-heme iron oxygenase ferredoxin subunit [Limnochordia bacterium]|nr:non-heme iron oxygenase ferredoxin subunit [Limnochordia bacterium]
MSDFVVVAKREDVPLGGALRVEVAEQEIALFNIDGEIYAIGDICSHARASLSEGDVDGFTVACPKHGSLFDVRTGEALTLPAFRPVPKYEVRITGDDVEVKV